MCGRFSRADGKESLQKRFTLPEVDLELQPRYNIAPGQEAAVVLGGQPRRLALMRWGLVPSWAADDKGGAKLINARAETAAERPSFRAALRRRRCLVPASGYYEWLPAAGGRPKTPVYFCRRDGGAFALAGIWESWRGQDKAELLTFAILTTTADELAAPVHSRMPVILRPKNEAAWLDPDLTGPAPIMDLLAPLPAAQMQAYQVSPLVNSPAHEGPGLIQPAPPAAPGLFGS